MIPQPWIALTALAVVLLAAVAVRLAGRRLREQLSPRAADARLTEGDFFLATAASVSAFIHCPVCRTPLGKRTESPIQLMHCPGCSRRIAARMDGDRLVVTVDGEQVARRAHL
jgi:hypothetical protein